VRDGVLGRHAGGKRGGSSVLSGGRRNRRGIAQRNGKPRMRNRNAGKKSARNGTRCSGDPISSFYPRRYSSDQADGGNSYKVEDSGPPAGGSARSETLNGEGNKHLLRAWQNFTIFSQATCRLQ